jgi:tRNA A-37 threonylcarbamoyl transferase component Bud32
MNEYKISSKHMARFLNLDSLPEADMCSEIKHIYCGKDDCDKRFRITSNRIGAYSTFGKIYITCTDENDCNYVSKWVNWRNLEMLYKEAAIQLIVSNHGLAPKPRQILVCNEGGLLIMDKVKGDTLYNKLTAEYTLETKKKIIDDTFECFKKLHLLGYVHRDAHLNNIMVEEGTNRIQLIDFGLSEDIKDFNQWIDYGKIQIAIKSVYLERMRTDIMKAISDYVVKIVREKKAEEDMKLLEEANKRRLEAVKIAKTLPEPEYEELIEE